jgi:hypothetical protein
MWLLKFYEGNMKQGKRIIVGCGIFEDELTEVLKEEKRFELEIYWLKSGYHVSTDKLAKKLAEVLQEKNLSFDSNLRILYGLSCLFDLDETIKSRLKVLPSDNCLTAMVGRQQLRKMEEGRTMVVTNSWLRKIFLTSEEDLPIWDEAEMRMNLGRYNRILVLDTGLEVFTDEEILTVYDLTGLVLEFEKCDLIYFKNLITDFLT